MTRLEQLKQNLQQVLGESMTRLKDDAGEITIECKAPCLLEVANLLHDHKLLKFEQLIDLCGVDYADYGEGSWSGLHYATVYHFLSVSLNQRLRLRVFALDDDFPVLPTVVDVWPAANWFERESFDLFGIMYDGHPDMRRLLTDYGFVGHPFRKDFPMIGNVEMLYNPEQQRLIYQPVTIDSRNNVPRVIREGGFHHD